MKRGRNSEDGEFGQTLAAAILVMLILACLAWVTG